MAAAVVTMTPMASHPVRDPPSEPGPSSSAAGGVPPRSAAKSFKRMFRTSLQETIRHVSNPGRSSKEKDNEPEMNKGRHGQAPPSAFMVITRPSLFRRSLESERKEVSNTSPVSPTSEDGRKSTTPSVSSTTASGAERRPRVLRKQSSRAPPPRADTAVAGRSSGPAPKAVSPPSKQHQQHQQQHPETGHSSADNTTTTTTAAAVTAESPGWGAFIPPTLSRGSMSSPALHAALREGDPSPDHHHQLKPTLRHRSPLASISALIAIPTRHRKQSLVLPPKSTVTPTPVPAAPGSRSQFHFEAPTRSSKSKIRESTAATPLTISRPKPMVFTSSSAAGASATAAPSIPPRSPSRTSQGMIATQNGTAISGTSHLNGNGHPSPPSSPKGSRFGLGMGYPSTSSRRLPGASASTSHLPLSNTSANTSTSHLLASEDNNASAGAAAAARNPMAPTAASLARKTSLEVKKPTVEKSRSSSSVDNNQISSGAGISRRTDRPARRPSMDAQTRPSLENGNSRPASPRRTSIDVRRPSVDARRPSIDSRRPSMDMGHRPSLNQGSATPRPTTPSTTARVAVPPSPTTSRARSPSATRGSSPSPVAPTRPTRLGRGIGSASTSHLPIASSSSSSSSSSPPAPAPPPPALHLSRSSSPASSSSGPTIIATATATTTTTRLMPRRPSHGHANSVPVAFPHSTSASPSGDEQRSASPTATEVSGGGGGGMTAAASPSPSEFVRGHRAKAASLDTASGSGSPQEMVRRAGTVLVRELVHRRSGWVVGSMREIGEELDKRMNGLVRMVEKGYGKSVAVGGAGGLGSEERERKCFAEAVRDGYVLCHFVNKLRPGCVPRITLGTQTNVTKFIAAAAAEFGLSAEELCEKEDFKSLFMENLAHIARTVLAVAYIAENPPPRKFVAGASSSSTASPSGVGSVYGSTPSSMSTPNLLRSASPNAAVKRQRRFSPPGPMLPTVRSASPTGDAAKDESAVVDEDVFGPMEYTDSPSSPQFNSRATPRVSTTSRTSVASSDATTAYSSLLDPRSSTRFGTIRTTTTEATSFATDTPSLTPTEASAAKASLLSGENDVPSSAAARWSKQHVHVSIPSSPVDGEPSPRRRHPDRRISDDLARVAEETDEGGTVPRNAGKSAAAEHMIHLRKGVWPDDFMEAFKYPRPTASTPAAADATTTAGDATPASSSSAARPTSPKSKKPMPIKIPSSDGSGGTEEVSLDSPTTFGSSPLPYNGNNEGNGHGHGGKMGGSNVSRPKRFQRTSELDKDGNELPPQPITPSSATRIRRKSTRTSSDSLLPKDAVVRDRDLSPVSSKNYGPRTKSEERLGRDGPVPFPRSVSGDFSSAAQRSSGSSDTVKEVSVVSSSKLGPPPTQARAGLGKERRSSFSDQQQLRAAPSTSSRPRHESMMNMGASTSTSKNDGLIGGMDGSAVRKTLVVKEEGKPSVHYQLGNCIGRGQFGSVYRALNLNNGQTVAVKRIRLEGLSEKEIKQLMHEVEIVKRLSHPSIVKYEGMARDSDTLSIVLEYAENGSLAQTLKAFGKLKENLVASYVAKVLEGLHYLHTSEVVHCDLKSANILTTKTGNVKLSDFGVSLNLRAMEQIKNDVAGTPNWMAPEVIELKGASPASDIWSLACTIIELLTGAPPYADIQNSMSVMFRIVEDDMPPIPDGLSELLQDFLKQCFNKDPAHRPDAVQLFEHPWLKSEWGVFQELRPHDSIPFLRRVSAEVQRSDIRSLQFADEDRPSSPRSITSITNATTVEGPPRPHDFVKSQFSQAVTCRVCNNPGKKSIMFCKQCNLIAHSKCVPDASEECEDFETRVMRLSLDLQRDAHFRQSSPSPLARQRSPPPGSRQTSPIPIPRQAMPSSPLSGSPANATPPTPIPTNSPPSDKSERFHLFGKKRSKASSLAGAASNESLQGQTTLQHNTPTNSPPIAYTKYDENTKPVKRMARTRSNDDEKFMTARSKRSRHSTSMRSTESTSEETQESNPKHAAQRASTVESELSRASRITGISIPEDLAAAADAGEEAVRKRRGSRRESKDRDSDGSRCIVQ